MWVKKMPPRYGFLGIATLLMISFGAYFSCERLREDAFRRGAWHLPTFIVSDCVSRGFVAGCDPRKYKPMVITDWPWSERAYPPFTGTIYGTVKDGDGRPAKGAVVEARSDTQFFGQSPWDETDADGHFAIHLRFGYYGVTACMGQAGSCMGRNWQAHVALGPASRVKTIELRLLK
jgi:hypothetical protein